MANSEDTGSRHIGPEPWRVEALGDYDGPPPVPLDAVREGLAVLESLDGWTIAHTVYVGSFGGVERSIPITYAEHPEHGCWQWFPIRPDVAEGPE